MQKHPIDDLFGRKLEQASLKPSADAWARLQERQGRQKRPVAMWWYASAAACLLLIGLAGWWGWRTNTDLTQNPIIARQETKPQPRVEQPSIKETLDVPRVEETDKPVITSVESKTIKQTRSKAEPSHVLAKSTFETAKPELTLPDSSNHVTEPESADLAKAIPVPQKETASTLPATEERTLVVQLAPPQEMLSKASGEGEQENSSIEQTQKKKRNKVGRILRQLNNLREGEPIDWKEVGVQPGNLLAKASKTVEESREKISDSYENIRSNAFRKNTEQK